MIPAISVKELHEKMLEGNLHVLDVRGEGSYQEWHIAHRNVESLNIQTSKLLANGPQYYTEIPKNQPVYVMCAKGHSSQEATRILLDAGYNAINVSGGMGAWSEFYYPATVSKSEDLELIQVVRPGKGCLSYFLVSGNEAVVVDPARHTDVYIELARASGVEIKYVLDTHCHADHISGGASLSDSAGASYWVSGDDMQGSTLDYHAFQDEQEFQFGSSRLKVIAIPTPGHTPGSMSFLVNDEFLLSGDTVFVSGLGRPDLGGKAKEWAKMFYETVQTKLNRISPATMVLPAHYSDASEITEDGYVAAVFEEIRNHNELLQGVSEEDFTDTVTSRVGLTPPNYTTIVQVNRGILTPSPDEASELEIGPNRCAVKHLS